MVVKSLPPAYETQNTEDLWLNLKRDIEVLLIVSSSRKVKSFKPYLDNSINSERYRTLHQSALLSEILPLLRTYCPEKQHQTWQAVCAFPAPIVPYPRTLRELEPAQENGKRTAGPAELYALAYATQV